MDAEVTVRSQIENLNKLNEELPALLSRNSYDSMRWLLADHKIIKTFTRTWLTSEAANYALDHLPDLVSVLIEHQLALYLCADEKSFEKLAFLIFGVNSKGKDTYGINQLFDTAQIFCPEAAYKRFDSFVPYLQPDELIRALVHIDATPYQAKYESICEDMADIPKRFSGADAWEKSFIRSELNSFYLPELDKIKPENKEIWVRFHDSYKKAQASIAWYNIKAVRALRGILKKP